MENQKHLSENVSINNALATTMSNAAGQAKSKKINAQSVNDHPLRTVELYHKYDKSNRCNSGAPKDASTKNTIVSATNQLTGTSNGHSAYPASTMDIREYVHASTFGAADQYDHKGISNGLPRGRLTTSVSISRVTKRRATGDLLRAINNTSRTHGNAEYQSGPCNAASCENCKFMKPTNTFKSTVNGNVFNIKQKITCKSKNVIYLIQCKEEGCEKQYVGETQRTLGARMNDHRSRMKKPKTPIAHHFSAENHGIENLEIIGIEIPEKSGEKYMTGGHYNKAYRIHRETYWQMSLEAIYPDGLSVK